MKVKISLSAPIYTQDQESILWTLLHDKDHILVRGRRSKELDGLHRKFGARPTIPLYRGLTAKEMLEIQKLNKQSKGKPFKLSSYMSFSEDKNIAKGFATTYKSGAVLELTASSSFRALCYYKRARDLIMNADLEAEFDGDARERAHVIELLDEELEWITQYDFSIAIKGLRQEGNIVYLKVEAF